MHDQHEARCSQGIKKDIQWWNWSIRRITEDCTGADQEYGEYQSVVKCWQNSAQEIFLTKQASFYRKNDGAEWNIVPRFAVCIYSPIIPRFAPCILLPATEVDQPRPHAIWDSYCRVILSSPVLETNIGSLQLPSNIKWSICFTRTWTVAESIQTWGTVQQGRNHTAYGVLASSLGHSFNRLEKEGGDHQQP